MTHRTFTVADDDAGERLDKVIAKHTGISRSVAASHAATIDGAAAPNSARLKAGQVIEVEIEDRVRPGIEPEEMDFAVKYEDRDVAVISKPPGLAVHSGSGRTSGTLVNGLVERWPRILEVGEPERPGIVHRLDAGTSGLMVVALSNRAYESLSRAIARREVEREYLALVLGEVQPPTGVVDAPIGRDSRRRNRMAVIEGGRSARTHYRAISEWTAGYSLMEIALETGRTHQIRVHMAAIGHPVAGDDTYGGGRASKELGLHRPFLHAARLAFNHPVTDERIEIAEPLPEDLGRALTGLGDPGDGT